jgi:hypothetical protein
MAFIAISLPVTCVVAAFLVAAVFFVIDMIIAFAAHKRKLFAALTLICAGCGAYFVAAAVAIVAGIVLVARHGGLSWIMGGVMIGFMSLPFVTAIGGIASVVLVARSKRKTAKPEATL